MENNVHILIVEDSPTQAVELEYLLDKNHYQVTVAKDGKKALEMLQQITPTIIISDIVMPEMNGYELCAAVKKNDLLKNIPVILLTSLSNPEDVINGLSCGANNFIVKPYNEHFLLSQIRYILANLEIRKTASSQMSIEIMFRDKKYSLNSERVQMIDLLLSTYEVAIQKNLDFQITNEKLQQAKDRLEDRVQERTAELLAANVELQKEIKKRKQAEQVLKESEERYRTIFEGTAEGIVVVCIETRRFRYCNQALCEMLGYTKEELTGLGVTDIHPKESLNHVLTEFEAQARGDKTLAPSIPCLRKDGSVVYADVKSTLAVIDGLDCRVGFFNDVTMRRQIEMQLRQAQKMEAIGTLAGGIAHDFNNILTAIIGFSELALDSVEKRTETEDDLQEIRIAGMRAKDLVKQILTFARQSDEELRPIQVNIIVKEVLKFIKSSIPTSIRIQDEIISDSLIMGSPTHVHQMLMNLCTNSSQAMEEKGGILKVSLNDVVIDKIMGENLSLLDGEYIEIKVSDTGIGIPSRDMNTIFEPYFSTKKIGEGTGMGLAVVHGIVESYGGKITVDSTMGKGTVFTIYLPISKNRITHDSFKEEVLPTGKEHILFVDDEAPISKMGSRLLEQLGYTVTSRTNSVEALELFKSKPKKFDLVITDMTMPNMTGDKLAVELIKIRPGIPVVLCTGYSKMISEENASEIGIKAFAYKPITKADLAKTVRKVLDEAKGSIQG